MADSVIPSSALARIAERCSRGDAAVACGRPALPDLPRREERKDDIERKVASARTFGGRADG
jgi:hypothetical protein